MRNAAQIHFWRAGVIQAACEQITAFHRGRVETLMRDRRMVGRLAVSDCRMPPVIDAISPEMTQKHP